jgi:hypothetical protein
MATITSQVIIAIHTTWQSKEDDNRLFTQSFLRCRHPHSVRNCIWKPEFRGDAHG